MKKTLNRKQFLILGVGAAAAGLVGCAGDDGDPIVGTGGSGNGTGGTGSGTGGAGSGGAGSGGAGSGGAASGGAASGGAASGGDSATGGAAATGGDAATGGGGGDECSDVTAEDQNTTHQHAVTVPAEDVAAGVEKTYPMGPAGMGNHTHMLTVTAANFATLLADGMVTVTSAPDGTHLHDVLITCA